jgi:hypothetical protein
LYKRKFFEKASPYLWREGLLVCGIIGENYLASHFICEYFWKNSREIIRKNAYLKE